MTGCWCVPFVPSPFGSEAVLWADPPENEIVLVLERTVTGWAAAEARRWVSLPHQLYLEKLQPLVRPGVYELAVVGLRSGRWMKLWCGSVREAGWAPVAGGWWSLYGAFYRVLWAGESVDEANAYMLGNPAAGVLVEAGGVTVVASLADLGLRSVAGPGPG